jgi:hypothetical protein
MSNTGNFNDGRTPTWNTAATGTPTGNPDGVNPFAWTAGEGASAPLSTPLSQQFANEAHKAVHDEVMKVCCCSSTTCIVGWSAALSSDFSGC